MATPPPDSRYGPDDALPYYRVLEAECSFLREGPVLPAFDEYEKARVKAEAEHRCGYCRPVPERAQTKGLTEPCRRQLDALLLPKLLNAIHASRPTALCLSGGGIRSATFCLGVLQGLARQHLLDTFTYLSTVSGGGYTGSWVSAWLSYLDGLRRAPEGEADGSIDGNPPAGISASGATDATGAGGIRGAPLKAVVAALAGAGATAVDPEPAPIRHLRAYSNFITPRLGFFSADTWVVVSIYLRNLFLNWLVIGPLLLALLLVPRLAVALALWRAPDWLTPLVFVAGIVLALMSVWYVGGHLPTTGGANAPHSDARWGTQGDFLRWCLLPAVMAAFMVSTAGYWVYGARGLSGNVRIAMLEPVSQSARSAGAFPLPIDGFTFVVLGPLLVVAVWLSSLWHRRRLPRSLPQRLPKGLLAIGASAGTGLSVWHLASQVIPGAGADVVGAYVCLAAPLLLVAFGLAGIIMAGALSYEISDDDREWTSRFGAWLLIAVVAWLAGTGLVIYGPWPILQLASSGIGQVATAGIGAVSGLATILGGASPLTPANHEQAAEQRQKGKGWQAMAVDAVIALAAPVFIFFLLAVLSLATDRLITTIAGPFAPAGAQAGAIAPHLGVIRETPGGVLVAILSVLLLLGLSMSFVLDVNKFSLHAMYRNRLIRAYLGAARGEEEEEGERGGSKGHRPRRRRPDPFTGFDLDDNVRMHELRPIGRPLHVLNLTLNLTAGNQLAWQERKATSFTVSALHSGNAALGYRDSELYGGPRGISLGTAMAISGAAVSPNMGFYTSPPIAFLLALFNFRLGWWFGNPGDAGSRPPGPSSSPLTRMWEGLMEPVRPRDTYLRRGPRWSLWPLIKELFGLTDDRYGYVYLSDGGHFENLGLYEMVRRRCHFILVCDGSDDVDFQFKDLGNAVRKIRIDFGISIDFGHMPIDPAARDGRGRYCAVGTIRYSGIDKDETGRPAPDGVLVYVKPVLYGSEPSDVDQYQKASPSFPHESTVDQWFSETQFESYRMLGLFAVEQIGGSTAGEASHDHTPEGFLKRVYDYLGMVRPPADGHSTGDGDRLDAG